MHSVEMAWGWHQFTEDGLLSRINAPSTHADYSPSGQKKRLEFIIPLTSENFDTAFNESVPDSLRQFAIESAYHAIRMISALTVPLGETMPPEEFNLSFGSFLYDWAEKINKTGRWQNVSEFCEFVVYLEEALQERLADQPIESLPIGGVGTVIIIYAHKFGVAHTQGELYIHAEDGRWKTFGCARDLDSNDILAWGYAQIRRDDSFIPRGLLGQEILSTHGMNGKFKMSDLCLRDIHEELDIVRKISARIADGESEPLSDVAGRLGLEMPDETKVRHLIALRKHLRSKFQEYSNSNSEPNQEIFTLGLAWLDECDKSSAIELLAYMREKATRKLRDIKTDESQPRYERHIRFMLRLIEDQEEAYSDIR